jgi:hypothetical protein
MSTKNVRWSCNICHDFFPTKMEADRCQCRGKRGEHHFVLEQQLVIKHNKEMFDADFSLNTTLVIKITELTFSHRDHTAKYLVQILGEACPHCLKLTKIKELLEIRSYSDDEISKNLLGSLHL